MGVDTVEFSVVLAVLATAEHGRAVWVILLGGPDSGGQTYHFPYCPCMVFVEHTLYSGGVNRAWFGGDVVPNLMYTRVGPSE